jgi:peptidoglycan/xylan/chitin deacetylase (PgdA/CDA1 family)
MGSSSENPPLALAFHGVAELPLRRDPKGLFVAPRHVRRHIETLRGWGYRLVTFGELARRVGTGQGHGLAALTFDDGFADNLEVLVPLLKEEEATATVFICTGMLGRRHPSAPWARTLTAGDVRALAESSIEIGSHGSTHRDFSTLSYEEAFQDLSCSRAELEEITGRPVAVFAYPYGSTSEVASRACADAGFEAACRTSGEGSWTDPYNLPRQAVVNGSSSKLALWLRREDMYESVMRTLPVRAVRRAMKMSRIALGR